MRASGRVRVDCLRWCQRKTNCSMQNTFRLTCSIMETDAEGKIVSLKLFLAVNCFTTDSRPRLKCVVCCFHRSTKAEGVIMDLFTIYHRILFVCTGRLLWAKLRPRQKRCPDAAGPTIASSLSCSTCSFAKPVSTRSLAWRGRENNLEKAAEEIWTFSVFFHCTTSQCICLKWDCLVPSMLMIPMLNASWPAQFRVVSFEYLVY